jgi:hypothetical protein
MAQLANGLKGTNFPRRGLTISPLEELEGERAAIGRLALPDLGKTSSANQLAEAVSRKRLHSGS